MNSNGSVPLKLLFLKEIINLMIQEAGFITFLRTIAIILLVIYGLKFIAKYLLPIVLKKAVNKAQERAQQRNTGFSSAEQDVKVGETIIDKKPQANRNNQSKDVGDYVDYEEVD